LAICLKVILRGGRCFGAGLNECVQRLGIMIIILIFVYNFLLMINKQSIISEVISNLSKLPEIDKIVLFGSFIKSDSPNDLDIAVFSSSSENYITLALSYRKSLRNLARKISLDIIPLKTGIIHCSFLDEINSGEVIYERRNENLA
jgi:uncharacterized protein